MEWPREKKPPQEASGGPSEGAGVTPPEGESAPDPVVTIDPGAVFPLGEVPSGSLVTINDVNYTVVGASETHPGQIKVRGPSKAPAYFAEDIGALVPQLA